MCALGAMNSESDEAFFVTVIGWFGQLQRTKIALHILRRIFDTAECGPHAAARGA